MITVSEKCSAAYKPLFNGNISSMVVNIGQFNNPMLYAYTYDQLNRLTGMNAHTGFNQSTNSWSALSASNDYKESVEYDPNGNITRYQRNGVSSMNLAMDNLTYAYNKDGNGKLINNRLNHVADAVSSGNYTTDIDNQSADNYTYDEIGNLTGDNAEGITDIKWNVYGKIQEIQRNATDSNPTINIKYTYDAAGNRISKQVTNNSGNITYTWYSRDALGNVMSTYKSIGSGGALSGYSVDLSEQHLYGSSRLGILNKSVNLKNAYIQEDIVSFYRGYKQYELSNHLGNVLVTITDKKNGVSTNGTTIDSYTADVSSANDYYPFGMSMINRGFSVDKYRYGFNGQENEREISGTGNSLSFEARIYDSRLGKWYSLDPLQKKYPKESNYAFTSNSPILFMDNDGLDRIVKTTVYNNDGTTLVIERTYAGEYDYVMDASFSGGYIYMKRDIHQNVVVDNRQSAMGDNSNIQMETSYGNWQSTGKTDYFSKDIQKGLRYLANLAKSWVGDESDKTVSDRYVLLGNGMNPDWTKGLPKAGSNSEVIDVNGWMDLLGGLRTGASVDDLIESLVKKFGGVKGDMAAVKEAVDIVKDQLSKISEAVERTEKIKEDLKKYQKPDEAILPPGSDSCAICHEVAPKDKLDHIGEKTQTKGYNNVKKKQ